MESNYNMNYGFVRVGAFTPKIKVADTQANTAEIKKLIDQAEKEHTALAVFPELCITEICFYSPDC